MKRPAKGFLIARAVPSRPAYARRALGVLEAGLIGLLLVMASVSAHADPATRLALVIGNAAYPSQPLRTSLNDAALIAETLALDGFKVSAVADADRGTLRKALDDFALAARQAGPRATLVVYLAGYGVQYDGANYLVPVDATIARADDVPTAAMPIADVTKALEAAPAAARILVLDLARTNGFAAEGDMPLAGGLLPIAATPGWLTALNTQPGAVAPREVLPYGAFARALSEMMVTASAQPLATLFQRVRLRVGVLTNGAAVPWDDSGLDASTSLVPATIPSPKPTGDLSTSDTYSAAISTDAFDDYLDLIRAFPADRSTVRLRMIAAVKREVLFFEAALQANEARAYWTYTRRYPRGPHFLDVRRRLAALHAPLDPPPRFDIVSFPGLAPPTPDELAVFDRSGLIFAGSDWPSIPAPPSVLLPGEPSALVDGLPPPPLVPPGVLPIPIPVLWPDPPRSTPPDALIQEGAPHGRVEAATTYGPQGDTTITLTQAGVLLSKTTRGKGKDGTTLLIQTGPADAIIARTTILDSAQGRTLVETGPGGGVLSKAVSWTDPGGGRAILVRDGSNRIVADIQRNSEGVVIAATGTGQPPVPRYPAAAPRPPLATKAPPPVAVPPPAPGTTLPPVAAPSALLPTPVTPEPVAPPAPTSEAVPPTPVRRPVLRRTPAPHRRATPGKHARR